MEESLKPKDLLEVTQGVLKEIPVYQDLLQPTVKEVGNALCSAVKLALLPLKGLIWGYDKIEDYLMSSITKKLEKVPPEKIITPDPHVVGPAIEALKYTAQNPNLREMFSSLIASSMDPSMRWYPQFGQFCANLS